MSVNPAIDQPAPQIRTTNPKLPGNAQTGASRAKAAADAYKASISRWLDWQCRMVVGVNAGAVYVPQEQGSEKQRLAGGWPNDAAASNFMLELADQSFATRRNFARKAKDDPEPDSEVHDHVTYLVAHGDRPVGVVVLALEIRSEVQRQAVIQLLDWGTVWLEKALIGMNGERRESTSLSLQAIATLAADVPLAVASHQLCNLLAENFGCTRVGLGVAQGMQVAIVALSHQIQFDRRLANVVSLQSAMEECVDQGKTICVPRKVNNGLGLIRAHKRLLDLPETAAACSIPMLVDDQIVGALTMTWESADGVDGALVPLVGDLARQLAPVLVLKQREERSGLSRIGKNVRAGMAQVFGSGHLMTKLFSVGACAALAASLLIETPLRVSAPSLIEGTTQQTVVAPMAGYLESASVRAGDEVEKDQVLAVIDDRELLLEKQRWQSERDKHVKEYQEALGARERSAVSIASARMAQADAQLRLVEDQIARTRLRAPFAGTLVSGDLSRAIGSPLERGQRLFEIVPAGDYRISLQVDERDIAGLAPGQHGTLRLSGLPGTPMSFKVARIVPLATADASGNRFRVEAIFDGKHEDLRPGMQGIGKVDTERVSVLRAWTHELWSRLRFWAWSLGL